MSNGKPSDNKKKTSNGASWPVIVILMIFFWPVGLFLLVRKLKVDKKASLSNGTGMFALSAFLILMFFAGLDSEPVVAVFFLIGGIYVGLKARSIRKRSKNYKQYLQLIINEGILDTNMLASRSGTDGAACQRQINDMIERGFFEGYIDQSAGRLVLPNRHQAVQAVHTPGQTERRAENTAQPQPAAVQPAVAKTVEPKVVQCKCCGANNTVFVAMQECEYCGTGLKF